MARCLVVGGNGFIGSHVVDALAAAGHEVTAFDRFSAGTSFESPDIRILAGDFLNQADTRAALVGQQYVFHFLSTTTPASSENDPMLDVRTNIAASIELFEAAGSAGIERVVFASTGGAIYGDHPEPLLNESVLPQPVSPYAIGKLAIEGYLRYFRKKFGLSSVSLRISNPYGPRQRENKRQGVVPIFLHHALTGTPLTVFGDGTMVRDFLYVEDAAAMIAATATPESRFDTYNIGSGEGHSISEVIDVIRAVTGLPLELEHEPVPSTFVERVVLDTSRFVDEFGVRPVVSLEEGVRRTWDGMRGSA
jgi:UDP-glucose 4-epimerase